jgi:hypothetical protein
MSTRLNQKLGYLNTIRFIQMITLKVKSNGKKSVIIFVDLGDYERLQTNIIDHQKICEMVLFNSNISSLSELLVGTQNGSSLDNAIYGSSKLTKYLKLNLQRADSAYLNIGFLCTLQPSEAHYSDVLHTLSFLNRFTKQDDPRNLFANPSSLVNLTSQQKALEILALENLSLKTTVDNFRRAHTSKLNSLRINLGIPATSSQFEAIAKAKPGSREH